MKSRIKYSCATKWNKYMQWKKKHVYNCHMFLHFITFIFPSSSYYLVFTLQAFPPSLLAGMLSNVHPCLILVYISQFNNYEKITRLKKFECASNA